MEERASHRHDLGDVVSYLNHTYGVMGRARHPTTGEPTYDLRPMDFSTPAAGHFVCERDLDPEDDG